MRWARRHAPNMLDVAGIVKKLTRDRPEALPVVWEACAIVAEIATALASTCTCCSTPSFRYTSDARTFSSGNR